MTSPEYQAPTWVNEDDPAFIEGVSPDLGAGYLNQVSGAVEDHGQRLGAVESDVTTLQATALDQADGDARYILQSNANGFAPAEATANALAALPFRADNVTTAGAEVGGVVAVTGVSGGVPTGHKYAQAPIDVRMMGAAADGTTDDMTAFSEARAAAGANGIVKFSAKPGASVTTYYLAGTRPDLSGTQIAADPTVVLKLDENPNTKTARFLTPVTIQNTTHATTIRKGPGVDLPLAVAAAAAGLGTASQSATAVDLTTWTGFQVSSALTFGTFTGTVAANLCSWASAFASGQQGIIKPARIGAYYEATFEDTGSAGGSVFLGVTSSDSDAHRADWSFTNGAPSRIIDSGTVTVLTDPGNGDAYRWRAGGSILLGIRLLSATEVEVYANGVLIDRATLAFSIFRVNFTMSSAASASANIKDVVVYDAAPAPVSSRDHILSVVGDSKAYGAWTTLTYADLLGVALAGLPGGGQCTIRQNLAVAGATAQQWATAAGTYDIAQYTFQAGEIVVVDLGTNDGQGGRTPAQYIADMTYIANKIVADGAIPVFVVWPLWTQTSISGVTGVTTTNYATAARLRGALLRWAASNGYQVARVDTATGKSLKWLGDNIHPTEMALAVYAQTVAAAIARVRNPNPAASRAEWTEWTTIPGGWFANSWVSDQAPQYRFNARQGRFELRGAIKTGTVGSAALNVPSPYRPPFTTRLPAMSFTTGSVPTPGAWVATSAGAMSPLGVDNNRVSLDGIGWSTV